MYLLKQNKIREKKSNDVGGRIGEIPVRNSEFPEVGQAHFAVCYKVLDHAPGEPRFRAPLGRGKKSTFLFFHFFRVCVCVVVCVCVCVRSPGKSKDNGAATESHGVRIPPHPITIQNL